MQWTPTTSDGEAGPDIFMLTADLALAMDELYGPISQEFAGNLTQLNQAFSKAWYRLTSADMGPATRCIGDMVPDPQPFQFTLPKASEPLPDYVKARTMIETYIMEDKEKRKKEMIELALNSASTFRATDYRGGVNGARIRFEPESAWESNANVMGAVAALATMKESMPEVSMADWIVLSGITALEMSNPSLSLPFCGGYVDAEDGNGSNGLAPRIYSDPFVTVTDDFLVKGLTMEQGVALASAQKVGSQWYKDLMAAGSGGNGTAASRAAGDFDELDKALLQNDLGPIVEKFSTDEQALLTSFTEAWTYLMTADRFVNNMENACTGVSIKTTADGNDSSFAPMSWTTTIAAVSTGLLTAWMGGAMMI